MAEAALEISRSCCVPGRARQSCSPTERAGAMGALSYIAREKESKLKSNRFLCCDAFPVSIPSIARLCRKETAPMASTHSPKESCIHAALRARDYTRLPPGLERLSMPQGNDAEVDAGYAGRTPRGRDRGRREAAGRPTDSLHLRPRQGAGFPQPGKPRMRVLCGGDAGMRSPAAVSSFIRAARDGQSATSVTQVRPRSQR